MANETLLDIALAEDDLQEARRLVRARLDHIKKWDAVGLAYFLFAQIPLWQHRLGRAREAAFWIGCFQRVQDDADQPLPKVERPRYQRMVNEVSDALGVEAYRAAYDEGYGTCFDDAVERLAALVG